MNFIRVASLFVGAVVLPTCAFGAELNAKEPCQAGDCVVPGGTLTNSFIQRHANPSKKHVEEEEQKQENRIEAWQDDSMEDGFVNEGNLDIVASRSESMSARKDHTNLMEQVDGKETARRRRAGGRRRRAGGRRRQKPLTDAEWEKALGPQIEYHQLKQGALGDCYFLAALVAIAQYHKEIIRNMFIDGSLLTGDNPVYTTEWLINGKKSVVAMNDKVPTNSALDEVWFASGKKSALWPAVLEKAWAKIFGNYKKTEFGWMSEAFKAITQAPVEVVNHGTISKGRESKNEYWQTLLHWSKSHFPMTAFTGSGRNNIGIVSGHAFALLEASEHEGANPQRLKIFNPHSQNAYKGVLPNPDEGDGTFFVTFDEFLHNFRGVDVARVQKGYVVSDISLSLETQSSTVLEFDMDKDEPFAVQFEWPSERLLSSNCQVPKPAFTVGVAKVGSVTNFKLMQKAASKMTNARVDIPGGAGKYLVFVKVRFPVAKNWLKEFVVNIYGPQTQLVLSTQYSKPLDLFLDMQGLCRTIMVPGTGKYKGQAAAEYTLDEGTEVNGMPIFLGNTKDNGKQVASWYQVIYWSSLFNKWQVMRSIERAKAGSYYQRFNGIPGASCSANLLQQHLLPEDAVLAEAVPEVASEEPLAFDEMAELGNDVLDLEGDCAMMVERLSSLGSGPSIASSGTDGEFPESMKSIASPGTTCGDTAQGISVGCEKFNSWQSLAVLKEKYAAGKSLEAQCEKDCSAKECVPKALEGGSCIVDFSKCSVPLRFQRSDGVAYTIKKDVRYRLQDSACTDDSFQVVGLA